jgi:hypothetical protein
LTLFIDYFPNLNHFGTFPVDDFVAFEAIKFLGTGGFDELVLGSLSSLISEFSFRFFDFLRILVAAEPDESFSINSCFIKFESTFASHPKCNKADGTQFNSIRVSFLSRIVFGGVVTVK